MSKQILNPTRVKQLLVEADEMRNVLRKSEVMGNTQNLAELSKKLRNIDELRLNLVTGQQCVRDFFVCLSENIENKLGLSCAKLRASLNLSGFA